MGLMKFICRCGNMIEAYVDKWGVYYCDVCETHHEMDTED